MRCLQGSGPRAQLPLFCPAVGTGAIRTRWKQMPTETSSVGGGGPCTYHHHHTSQNAQLCVTGPKPTWKKHYLGKKHNYPLLISPLWMLLVLCYDIKTITFQSEFGIHQQAFCAQRKCQWPTSTSRDSSSVHCFFVSYSFSLEALLFLLINKISIYVIYGYVSM